MNKKQVSKEHYEFSRYVQKGRWLSMWHQLDEVLSLKPNSVLELGPGPGLFKATASAFGTRVETVDIDPELNPDHLASVLDMPFPDDTYDVVCAFQMLEHLPYTDSLKAFSEMVRVSKKHIIISLPNAKLTWRYLFYKAMWRYLFHIPRHGEKRFVIKKPMMKPIKHCFDGEHYWEIGKEGYPVEKVIADLKTNGKVNLTKNYRVKENPYHHFFVFEK